MSNSKVFNIGIPERSVTHRRLKVGIVGIGRISQKHFEAIGSLANLAELVAICDTNASSLSSAHALGAKTYDNLSTMLDNEKLDLVSVCTPSGLHPIHGIEIAKRGVNVVVEKPMATQMASARELVSTCEKANVRLFVVKQNRYNTTLQLLKAAIEESRFGRIFMIAANVFWTRPQSYYDQASWRGTWELDGGAFMNQASHYIDLMQWLGGPVRSVNASIATLARNIEAEDTGSAILNYRNGAIGSVNVTMLTYPKNLEGSITILGEKGTVKIGGVALNQFERWEFADERPEDMRTMESSYNVDSVYGSGHAVFYSHVFKTLMGSNTEPIIDGAEGLKSLELLEAIYLAAREERLVHIEQT